MLEIVTGVDIRYQGLFGRMSEMRAPAKGGHKGPTLVMRRFHSNRGKIVSYAKRRISKPSSRASRPLETFAKTCRSVGVSSSLAINLNNK